MLLILALFQVKEGGPVVQGMIEREGKSIKQVLWSGTTLVFTYVTHSLYCIYCVATYKYKSGREVYVNDMVSLCLYEDSLFTCALYHLCVDVII